jgi:hypothetical protein
MRISLSTLSLLMMAGDQSAAAAYGSARKHAARGVGAYAVGGRIVLGQSEHIPGATRPTLHPIAFGGL